VNAECWSLSQRMSSKFTKTGRAPRGIRPPEHPVGETSWFPVAERVAPRVTLLDGALAIARAESFAARRFARQ
jgi:hypothetical protein